MKILKDSRINEEKFLRNNNYDYDLNNIDLDNEYNDDLNIYNSEDSDYYESRSIIFHDEIGASLVDKVFKDELYLKIKNRINPIVYHILDLLSPMAEIIFRGKTTFELIYTTKEIKTYDIAILYKNNFKGISYKDLDKNLIMEYLNSLKDVGDISYTENTIQNREETIYSGNFNIIKIGDIKINIYKTLDVKDIVLNERYSRENTDYLKYIEDNRAFDEDDLSDEEKSRLKLQILKDNSKKIKLIETDNHKILSSPYLLNPLEYKKDKIIFYRLLLSEEPFELYQSIYNISTNEQIFLLNVDYENEDNYETADIINDLIGFGQSKISKSLNNLDDDNDLDMNERYFTKLNLTKINLKPNNLLYDLLLNNSSYTIDSSNFNEKYNLSIANCFDSYNYLRNIIFNCNLHSHIQDLIPKKRIIPIALNLDFIEHSNSNSSMDQILDMLNSTTSKYYNKVFNLISNRSLNHTTTTELYGKNYLKSLNYKSRYKKFHNLFEKFNEFNRINIDTQENPESNKNTGSLFKYGSLLLEEILLNTFPDLVYGKNKIIPINYRFFNVFGAEPLCQEIEYINIYKNLLYLLNSYMMYPVISEKTKLFLNINPLKMESIILCVIYSCMTYGKLNYTEMSVDVYKEAKKLFINENKLYYFNDEVYKNSIILFDLLINLKQITNSYNKNEFYDIHPDTFPVKEMIRNGQLNTIGNEQLIYKYAHDLVDHNDYNSMLLLKDIYDNDLVIEGFILELFLIMPKIYYIPYINKNSLDSLNIIDKEYNKIQNFNSAEKLNITFAEIYNLILQLNSNNKDIYKILGYLNMLVSNNIIPNEKEQLLKITKEILEQ